MSHQPFTSTCVFSAERRWRKTRPHCVASTRNHELTRQAACAAWQVPTAPKPSGHTASSPASPPPPASPTESEPLGVTPSRVRCNLTCAQVRDSLPCFCLRGPLCRVPPHSDTVIPPAPPSLTANLPPPPPGTQEPAPEDPRLCGPTPTGLRAARPLSSALWSLLETGPALPQGHHPGPGLLSPHGSRHGSGCSPMLLTPWGHLQSVQSTSTLVPV